MSTPVPQDWRQLQEKRQVDRVALANIITGHDRLPAQALAETRPEVHHLEPFTRWLEEHLERPHPIDPVEWFRKVVQYFSDNRDASISSFWAAKGSEWRPDGGNFHRFVLECLSYWLTIEILHRIFDDIDDNKNVMKNLVADFRNRTERDVRNGNVSLKELIENGRLIHKGTHTDPLKMIPAKALNVHRLVRFGRLNVRWTTDISEHLRIVERHNELRIFCLPCLITVQESMRETPALEAFRYYIPEEYVEEVQRSYFLLFGSKPRGRRSFKRALKSDPDMRPEEVDPVLRSLCAGGSALETVWARDKFAYLWPRILELKNYLDNSEPESAWGMLWHDKDQPYVWVPAVVSFVILLLTLAATGASIAQTWKAFHP